jgi:hypothetical protein
VTHRASSRRRRRPRQAPGATAAPVVRRQPPAQPARPAPARRARPAEDHLPPRDRGPVRAYVRDAVDVRRRVVGLFMPVFAVVLISALGPASPLQRLLLAAGLLALAVVAVDAVLLGRAVTRMARAEFPAARVGGWSTGWYAFMRAHRPRRMRLPPPRVPVGG